MLGFKRMLYRFVRKLTSPIPGNKAEYWKGKLSIAYALIAWNCFGIVCYYIFTGRRDWPLYYGLKTQEEADKRPGIYYAELLGFKKATIVRMQGISKVEEFEYEGDTPDKENTETLPADNSETLNE